MAKIKLSTVTVLKNIRPDGKPATYTAPEGTVVEHTSRAAPDDPALTIHRVQVVRAGETFALERRRPAPGKAPPPKVAPAASAQPAPRPAAVPPKTAPRVVSAKSLQPTVLTPQEVAVASRAHVEAELRDREELPSEPDPKLAQQEAALARIAAAETERQERLAAHREGLVRAAARKAEAVPVERLNGSAGITSQGTLAHVAVGTIGRTEGRAIDHDERRLDQLQRAIAVTVDQDFFEVEYDIPSVSEEGNPSSLFWRYGFRNSLSCWVFTTKGIQAKAIQGTFARWRASSPPIKVRIIRYHPDDKEQVKEWCRAKLREEVMRLHESLLQRIANASDRYEEAVKAIEEGVDELPGRHLTSKEQEKLNKAKDNAIRGAIRSSGEALNACIECAKAFDESESVADLIAALRSAVNAKTQTYNAAQSARGFYGSRSLQMVR